MAIARLAHVALLSPRNEIETLLPKLCEFGEYHPLDKEGLIQDIDVLILSSRAQGIYSDATHLLPSDYSPNTASSRVAPVAFEAKDLPSLVDSLSGELSELQRKMDSNPDLAAKKTLIFELEAVREAALALFNDLRRIRFTYEDRRFALMEGFIPSKHAESFRNLTGDYFLSSEPVSEKEADEIEVPSMFSNRRAVSLFESVTLMRGFPKYNEIDPTPIIAIIFPLFFGIMFSDLGHGIVLSLLGYALYRMFRGNYNYWGKLLIVLGSASIISGLIRGSFFGFEFDSPLRLILPFPSVLISGYSISAVAFWLEVSIILGTIHLSSGYFLYFMNRIRSKEYSDAFLSGLSTLTLYVSGVPLMLAAIGAGLQVGNMMTDNSPTPFFKELLGVNLPVSLVASISVPIFLVSIAVLVSGRIYAGFKERIGRWRIGSSVLSGLLEGIVKPFEFFTNTISYLRLGILLILGTILATISKGALALGFAGIIVVIFANIAIMAIEGFMVFIQDLRLNVYEWFSNFYTGSGTQFDPLVSKGLNFSIHWRF